MSTKNPQAAIVEPLAGRQLNILGTTVTLKATSAVSGGDHYLFHTLVPPGLGVPPHTHEREDEVMTVLEGEFEIMLDGQTQKATAGTVAYFPRHVAHGFRNRGKTPARNLVFVSPGGNFEAFFEELSRLPTDGAPEMSQVIEIFNRYAIRLA